MAWLPVLSIAANALHGALSARSEDKQDHSKRLREDEIRRAQEEEAERARMQQRDHEMSLLSQKLEAGAESDRLRREFDDRLHQDAMGIKTRQLSEAEQARRDEQYSFLTQLYRGGLDQEAQQLHASTMGVDAMGRSVSDEYTMPLGVARALLAPQHLMELGGLVEGFLPPEQQQDFMGRMSTATKFLSPEHIPEQYRETYLSSLNNLYEMYPHITPAGFSPWDSSSFPQEGPDTTTTSLPPDPRESGMLRTPGMLGHGASGLETVGDLWNRVLPPTGGMYHDMGGALRGIERRLPDTSGMPGPRQVRDSIFDLMQRLPRWARSAQFGSEPNPYEDAFMNRQQGMGLPQTPAPAQEQEMQFDLLRRQRF